MTVTLETLECGDLFIFDGNVYSVLSKAVKYDTVCLDHGQVRNPFGYDYLDEFVTQIAVLARYCVVKPIELEINPNPIKGSYCYLIHEKEV